LFGLAPGGACHAADVAADAVGSYPTLSPFPGPEPRRFAFCGAIPRVTPGGSYPPPLHRGARTFLDKSKLSPRPPGRLAGAKCARTRRASIQNAGDALDAGQLQQADQAGAGLTVGDAADAVGPPVALEGLDGQAGFVVVFAARLQPIPQPVQARAQDDDAQPLVARRQVRA